MTRKIVLSLICIATASCASTESQELVPGDSLVIMPGDLATFEAILPATSTNPRCDEVGQQRLSPGEHRLSMVFGPEDAVARRVTMTYDREGEAVRYADIRGAFLTQNGRERGGEGMTVNLDFAESLAIIQSQPDGGNRETFRVPLSEAIASEKLGSPDATLQTLRETCGSK